MAMKERVLKVTFQLPSGEVVLTQGLRMQVRISKAALAAQNKAVIEVFGMDTKMREGLLSQFTAWNKRKAEQGDITPQWIPVSIEAGYKDSQGDYSSLVFKGEVALVEPSSPPPNISVRITAYTNQINKTKFVTAPAPAELTLEEYVAWAAGQMGLGTNYICDTSYNKSVITNPSRSTHIAAALVIDIQNAYRQDIAAYVDDGVLIVKDAANLINANLIANVTEFVGTPSWNEWGVEFLTMFDPAIKVGQAVNLTSVMNPSINGNYVTTELDYDLTSRDKAFYVRGSGSPPA